jgi:hypothetical protein
MLLPIFYPTHTPPMHWSHPELSLPLQQQIQLTSKGWLLSKTIAQKCSDCSVIHPSKLHSAKQALSS